MSPLMLYPNVSLLKQGTFTNFFLVENRILAFSDFFLDCIPCKRSYIDQSYLRLNSVFLQGAEIDY
jgi:hypothetical protein